MEREMEGGRERKRADGGGVSMEVTESFRKDRWRTGQREKTRGRRVGEKEEEE